MRHCLIDASERIEEISNRETHVFFLELFDGHVGLVFGYQIAHRFAIDDELVHELVPQQLIG